MSVVDKMWDGLAKVIRMDTKVEGLAEVVKDQQSRIEDLTGRVIRLETALELAILSRNTSNANHQLNKN